MSDHRALVPAVQTGGLGRGGPRGIRELDRPWVRTCVKQWSFGRAAGFDPRGLVMIRVGAETVLVFGKGFSDH